MMKEKFALGQTVSTRNAVQTLNPEDVLVALRRHASGDWGDCGSEDWESNEEDLRNGERLLSVYHDRNGVTFWIITEWTGQLRRCFFRKIIKEPSGLEMQISGRIFWGDHSPLFLSDLDLEEGRGRSEGGTKFFKGSTPDAP